MSSDMESLAALEVLMSEFFAPLTTNARKREIENMLENFSRQNGAWKHCLYYMVHTSNHYVCMYCLTTIENVIHWQWIGLMGDEKSELRSTLYRFLLEHHKTAPTFIRNKLAKLLVDVARLDWPHFYPDFFTNILQLTQNPDTMVLGLVYLLTTSEELGCPREDLSMSRKEELHRLLLEQVPHVLALLSGILESILDKQKHAVTATPPPSPTQVEPSEPGKSLFSTSPIHTGSFLGSLFQSMYKKLGTNNPFSSLPPLDIDNEDICALVLQVLAHLFSWIPLSSYITPNLLAIIFHYASLGADPQHNKKDTLELDNFVATTPSLGVLAMGAVNELMYKNCIPADFEEFLLQLFENAFHLLQRLVQDVDVPSINNRLHQLDEIYVEKFTEFLHLFVSVHLRRFEGNSRFPVLEFLALLFKYTFQQPAIEGFFACLEIWSIFLDYISTHSKTQQNDGAIVERYREALIALVNQVLRNMQFKYNQSQLEEMDDENLDDNQETEWQHFLRQCIEIVAKIADILPNETLEIVNRLWTTNCDAYLTLEGNVSVDSNNERHLNVTAEHECRKLHCYLRDLSSVLQELGRLSALFIGEAFVERFNHAHDFVEKLVLVAMYGTRLKLYKVHVSVAVVKGDFIEVHAQAMAALKAWCHWLAQLYSESHHQPTHRQLAMHLVTEIVKAVVPIVCDDEPEKLVHSASHLLVTLTGTVCPPVLWELPQMQHLFQKAPIATNMQPEAYRLLQRSLVNVLLLPWPGVQEQMWEKRKHHLDNYIKSITVDFRNIRNLPNFNEDKVLQEQARSVIIRALQIIGDQVENIVTEVTQTKKVCYSCIQDLIQQTLWLFPIYVLQPDVCEQILGFFLVIFNVLQAQMGVTFVEQTVQTFLDVFTREQLSYTILHEGSEGTRIVEKFLKILQLIVKEPSSAFRRFLPSTITLCMDHIFPIIADRSSPDIKAPLFELLHKILLYNWRYFFKSSILTTFGAPGHETVENKVQFEAIMKAFGQSFLQSDIVIFKQNLEALESVNSKWKLYHKGLFRGDMLVQFLNVLLQVLVHKAHDLLKEEVAITIYSMASVDFDAFYSTFLVQFLQQTDGLDDNQRSILKRNFKMETDLPSFTQNVHRFISDLRYYRLCNSSLPAGSIKF